MNGHPFFLEAYSSEGSEISKIVEIPRTCFETYLRWFECVSILLDLPVCLLVTVVWLSLAQNMKFGIFCLSVKAQARNSLVFSPSFRPPHAAAAWHLRVQPPEWVPPQAWLHVSLGSRLWPVCRHPRRRNSAGDAINSGQKREKYPVQCINTFWHLLEHWILSFSISAQTGVEIFLRSCPPPNKKKKQHCTHTWARLFSQRGWIFFNVYMGQKWL